MNLIFDYDPLKMQWFKEGYASVTAPEQLSIKVTNTVVNRNTNEEFSAEERMHDDINIYLTENEYLRTRIELTNMSDKSLLTGRTSVSIRFPLMDSYEEAAVSANYRCHSHVFCGRNISYVLALRMGGAQPHLGMVLTNGSFVGYGIERDVKKKSNDRGIFMFYPEAGEYFPGETKVVEWVVFAHAGRDDFEKKLKLYKKYVEVIATDYCLFENETTDIAIRPSFDVEEVFVNGTKVKNSEAGFVYSYYSKPADVKDSCEKVFQIKAGDMETTCRIHVQREIEELANNRCNFIMNNQQYRGKDNDLYGAFLAYDNEEKHMVYSPVYDYNAGRERVGMALAMITYLELVKNGRFMLCPIENRAQLEKSLDDYVLFVKRELVNIDTGEVYNDYKRDNSFRRLYNYPWYAELFIELYNLYGRREDLEIACNIIERYYDEGGIDHYPVELPALSLCECLKNEKMVIEYENALHRFTEHADKIIQNGTNYPSFEVNYEQRIVEPAANILLQVYLLTKREAYLDEGLKHMQILELFNGFQPDCHLYETAIRHWDVYWFGKKKMFGDTFPHYLSALTGVCFGLVYEATGDKIYAMRCNDSLRGALTLIRYDGTASCAYVYPRTVNGVAAEGYDPYANDQDWALYFYLRALRDREEVVK